MVLFAACGFWKRQSELKQADCREKQHVEKITFLSASFPVHQTAFRPWLLVQACVHWASLHLKPVTWFARANRLGTTYSANKAVLNFLTALHVGSCLTFCTSAWIFCTRQDDGTVRLMFMGIFMLGWSTRSGLLRCFSLPCRKGQRHWKVIIFLVCLFGFGTLV